MYKFKREDRERERERGANFRQSKTSLASRELSYCFNAIKRDFYGLTIIAYFNIVIKSNSSYYLLYNYEIQ